jgi:glycosyltransferase involved in cell wall biosynthesis
MNISTVIITKNEGDQIGRCVSQALLVSDEVIVIDAESTDQTVEIAEKNGARVFVRKWEGYGKAKNYGNSIAANDWILSLDGDEVLSDEFIDVFNNTKLSNGCIFEIDIRTFYNGKLLKSSGFYPLWKKRIFNRKEVSWNESDVHESLIFDKETMLKKIKGQVYHYSIRSKEQYQQKLDQYAKLGAIVWIKANKSPGFLKKIFGPFFRFFKSYILQRGILDGMAGMDLAKMQMQANRAKIRYYKALKNEPVENL